MVHSDVSGAAFTASSRYGARPDSREFMARLVGRDSYEHRAGLVRRGRLYHGHHKRSTRRSGKRTTATAVSHDRRMVERVMILMLAGRSTPLVLSPECDSEPSRRHAPDRTAAGNIAHRVRSGSEKDGPLLSRQVAHRIEKDDTTRFVFLYLVNRRIPVDFRQFLIRPSSCSLPPSLSVRLLVPRRFKKSVAFYKAAVRDELWNR